MSSSVPHDSVAGQVVLVTGCSSGFGDLIARTLAAFGCTVFATMRGVSGSNADAARSLQAWAAAQSADLGVLELDVTNTESVENAVRHILRRAGRIDVAVNNAGIAAGGPLEAFDIEQMQALFDVNVWGPLRVDKAVLPQMRARRSGLVIHVTSTLGRILPGSGGLYPASKWAAEGLAESLHYQLRPFGVELTILEPGSFPTLAVAKGLAPNDGSVAEEYAAVAPARRVAPKAPPDYTPPDLQEVADAVLELVRLPAGKRPLRKVVGPIFTEGVEEYNALYEQYRDRLIESLQRPDQAITWGRRG